MRRSLGGLLLWIAMAAGLPGGAVADEHEASVAGAEAQAPSAAWDQATVTELAGKLADAVNGLRDSARALPPDHLASGQNAPRMRLMDKLRLIERETRSLRDELAKGEGKDSTLPIFERIDRERRIAAEDARRMFFPETTLEKIRAARDVLEQLRPFYESVKGAGAGSDEPSGSEQ